MCSLELPPINATTYQWTVKLPSSTGAIAFAITDSKGQEAYTDEVHYTRYIYYSELPTKFIF